MSVDNPVDQAMRLFEYRELATNRSLPHDPDWPRVISESITPALAGERGKTNQEQCAYQAIRLFEWESGKRPLPWTKAFPLSVPPAPLVWYRRWWNKAATWGQSLLKRFNDFI